MKTFTRILVSALAAMILFTVSADAKVKNNKKDAEVTFITSIDCPSCVKKLEAKLPFEKGVKDLEINLEERTIWFRYNPKKTTKEKLAKAIENLGFTATEKVEESVENTQTENKVE